MGKSTNFLCMTILYVAKCHYQRLALSFINSRDLFHGNFMPHRPELFKRLRTFCALALLGCLAPWLVILLVLTIEHVGEGPHADGPEAIVSSGGRSSQLILVPPASPSPCRRGRNFWIAATGFPALGLPCCGFSRTLYYHFTGCSPQAPLAIEESSYQTCKNGRRSRWLTKGLMGVSPTWNHQWNETDPKPKIQLDLDFNGIPSLVN